LPFSIAANRDKTEAADESNTASRIADQNAGNIGALSQSTPIPA